MRALPNAGDEFQIRLRTRPDGLDVMTVVAEHTDSAAAAALEAEIRSRCEVRCTVEIVAPGTLPKAEMKAKRVFDERGKG